MTKIIKVSSDTLVDQSTSTTEIIELILKNRQITDIKEFLNPSFPQLSLKLTKAIELIKKVIASNGQILIYGDYDVDGITATAILWQSLYKLTKNVTPFVPHRQRDGYGIKAESFFRFQTEKNIKFDLLITVDNGIVAAAEIQKIKKQQKIEVIITDHHMPDDNLKLLTRNCQLVHSTLVSGSAISWFLAKELDKNADLGLAALGTVADCLPLTGINRSIVVHGLKELHLNPSPGVKKLIQVSNIKNPVSTYDLGFVLGPRINAVGRLADPTEALRLLCSQNQLQATKYAQSLNNFNQDRQILQKDSIESAEESVRRDAPVGRLNSKNNKIIIIDGEYNPGIIGLIAGRLTEKYYLPSIIIGIDGDVAKGSCRSIPELNIIEALRIHQDLFIDLGGHSGAAGFSILTKNIPKLKKAIIKSVNLKLKKIKLEPHLDVDAQMTLDAVTLANIKAISKLSPFGIGNPEPLFLFKNVIISFKKVIGSTGDHLKLKFACPPDCKAVGVDVVAFKKGDLDKDLNIGDSIDIVATLSINDWNNAQIPQMIIKEIVTKTNIIT